jgi:hypothetical protein
MYSTVGVLNHYGRLNQTRLYGFTALVKGIQFVHACGWMWEDIRVCAL